MDRQSQSAPAAIEDVNGISPYGVPPDNGGNGTDPAAQGDVRKQLIAYLRTLWEQRRFLFRLTAGAAVIAAVWTLLIPNRYESTTRIMPPESNSSIGGMGAAVLSALASKAGSAIPMGAVGGDLMGIRTSGQLFVGVLRSRTIADRLIERYDLKKAYRTSRDEDTRKRLAELTDVSEDRKSGILTVTVTDWDKYRATAIAQAYVNELNRVLLEVSTSAAHRERVFLEKRLKEVKQDLDQASRDFGQFSSKNTTIDVKEQGKAMVEAAAQLQGELIARQSELSGLEQIYTANNVRVRSVRARVAELQRQLQKIAGPDASLMAQSGKGGDDGAYPSIREIPMLGITYFDLMRRAKIQEVVYEMLTQQYEMAKVQEAKETPTAKVLDLANVPEKKSFPPRSVIVLAFTFFVFAAGAMWIVARARWDQIDDADPGKIFAQEVFQTVNAHMPWAPPNGSRWRAVTHKVWVGILRQPDPPTGTNGN